MRPVHLIGVPLDLGAGRRGVDMGPSAIRIAGLGERIAGARATTSSTRATSTRRSRRPTPRATRARRYIREIAQVCQALYERSLGVLRAGGLPVVLGGDHSLGAGLGGGVGGLRPRPAEAAGPAVDRRARRHEHARIVRRAATCTACRWPRCSARSRRSSPTLGGFAPKVRPERTVLIGIRNLDEREKDIVRASGVHVFTMKDIDRLGIAAVTEQAIAIATRGTAGIHVSFDVDVCDPAIAPGRRARRSRAASTTARRTW